MSLGAVFTIAADAAAVAAAGLGLGLGLGFGWVAAVPVPPVLAGPPAAVVNSRTLRASPARAALWSARINILFFVCCDASGTNSFFELACGCVLNFALIKKKPNPRG